MITNMLRFGRRRTYNRLNQMIDYAMNGTFEEGRYDESELSKLEVKWKRFISSSVLSKKKIEEERQSIKELVTDISHQTKTPLANIMLYTQLLEEQELNEQSREMVQEIQQQSEKLSFLIQSLVRISRLESGTFQLHPVENNVGNMVSKIITQALGKASVKKIGIRLDEKIDNYHAIFDEKWTREALLNILDNAIKYSPEESVITLGIRAYEMFICISIEDEGVGIPEEERAKVFGRFYRGTNVIGEDGVGVGLYLAREIITAENGYIKILQGKGIRQGYPGTIFQVYLPRK